MNREKEGEKRRRRQSWGREREGGKTQRRWKREGGMAVGTTQDEP